MKIVLNEESVQQSESGAITGEIYFSVGDRFFPEENWNDFVATILSWWINNLLSSKNSGHNLEFCFMDGPYSILGNLVDDEVYELAFINQNVSAENALFRQRIQAEDIKKMLLSACCKFFKIAAKKNIKQESIVGLRNLFVQLKNDHIANSKTAEATFFPSR